MVGFQFANFRKLHLTYMYSFANCRWFSAANNSFFFFNILYLMTSRRTLKRQYNETWARSRGKEVAHYSKEDRKLRRQRLRSLSQWTWGRKVENCSSVYLCFIYICIFSYTSVYAVNNISNRYDYYTYRILLGRSVNGNANFTLDCTKKVLLTDYCACADFYFAASDNG